MSDVVSTSSYGYITVIIIILLLIGIIIFLIVKRAKMFTEQNKQKPGIRSFMGFYCPPVSSTSSGTSGCGEQMLVDANGDNVIKCPAGYKPNIIGAYFEVYDPFQQCSQQATADLVQQCSDNPAYISCLSSSAASNWTIPTCQSSGSGGCLSRDASAFLQSYIDSTCSNGDCVVPINTDAFGPVPCSGDVSSGSSEYGSLPLIQGTEGTGQTNSSGEPVFSNPSTVIPSATVQGYYVHGIYTCV